MHAYLYSSTTTLLQVRAASIKQERTDFGKRRGPGRPDERHFIRIVETWDEEKKRSFNLLTNHFEFATATTISTIYKDLWQVALSFKAIKQN